MAQDGSWNYGGVDQPGREVLRIEVERARARAGSDQALLVDRKSVSVVVGSCRGGLHECPGGNGSLARLAAEIASAIERLEPVLGEPLRVSVEYRRRLGGGVSEAWILPRDRATLIHVWRGRRARPAATAKAVDDAKSLDTLLFVYSDVAQGGP